MLKGKIIKERIKNNLESFKMIELEAEKIETFKKKENEKKKKIEKTTNKTKRKELDLKEIAEKGK